MKNFKTVKNKSNLTEKFIVKENIIACDGGENFGHPLVYLKLKKGIKQVCPYCSKIYILKI